MALDLQSSQFITEVNLIARTVYQLSPTTSTFFHNLSKIGQQPHNANSLRHPLDVSPLGPMVSDRLRFFKRFLTCYFCIISCFSFLWAISLRHKPKRQQLWRYKWASRALHPHLSAFTKALLPFSREFSFFFPPSASTKEVKMSSYHPWHTVGCPCRPPPLQFPTFHLDFVANTTELQPPPVPLISKKFKPSGEKNGYQHRHSFKLILPSNA